MMLSPLKGLGIWAAGNPGLKSGANNLEPLTRLTDSQSESTMLAQRFSAGFEVRESFEPRRGDRIGRLGQKGMG
jgi:hypothetical protein